MKTEWGKIVENAISTLVAAIIIGAGVIVWNGATSVDKKVTAATTTLEQTITYTKKAVELVQSELIQIKDQNSNLVEAVNTLREAITATNLQATVKAPPMPIMPFASNQIYFSMPNLAELPQAKNQTEEHSRRLHALINVSQMPPVERDFIQKQLPPVPTTKE